jgi:hypothetical protein
MTTLTILKRGTAVAALATLTLAVHPTTTNAQSQQAQSQQTQAGQSQAAGETAPANETGIVTEGKQGTQAGEAPAQSQAAGETGIVTEGTEGTQAGEAPDQAATGDQKGQAASDKPVNETGMVTEGKQGTQAGEAPAQSQAAGETGIVTEGKEGTQAGEAPDQAATGDQKGQGQQSAGQAKAGQDMVVAKVGDREIRQSDVMTVIGLLPPQLQQQPPEMLIPIALDQLVMRELILQKAKEAGLENDPAVAALAQGASERAKEDAMVQVWLNRELGKAVTDAEVQKTYEAVKQQMGDQTPTMEVMRPQIEQELRQQAFLDLSEDLQAGAEITLYGPDGQPLTQ